MDIIKEIMNLANSEVNQAKFVKAVRRTMRWPQWKLADHLLTYQCYISRFERCVLKNSGEWDRIWFNLGCELNDICSEMDDGAIIFGMSIVLNYIDEGVEGGDRDRSINLLMKMSKRIAREWTYDICGE